MKPVHRRLLTRAIAVVPAVVVAAVLGDKAVGQLLVISQVRTGAGWLCACVLACAAACAADDDDVPLGSVLAAPLSLFQGWHRGTRC
jgi:Mn2+/Fe2+ NRAMP family transporter